MELRKLRRKEQRKREELAALLAAEETARIEKMNLKKQAVSAAHINPVPAGRRVPEFCAMRQDIVDDFARRMKEKRLRIKAILREGDADTERQRLEEIKREKQRRRAQRAAERKEAQKKQQSLSRGVDPTQVPLQRVGEEEEGRPSAAPSLYFDYPDPCQLTQQPHHDHNKHTLRYSNRRNRNNHHNTTRARREQDTQNTGSSGRGAVIDLKDGEYVHIMKNGVLCTEDGPRRLVLSDNETLLPCCADEPHAGFVFFASSASLCSSKAASSAVQLGCHDSIAGDDVYEYDCYNIPGACAAAGTVSPAPLGCTCIASMFPSSSSVCCCGLTPTAG